MTKPLPYFLKVAFLLFTLPCLNTWAQSDIDFVKAARKSWDNLNYFSAKDQYKRAIEVNQSNFDANLELGILQVEVYQNYQEALSFFEKALQEMPADTVYEVYQFLGETYHQLGRYKEAKQHLKIFEKGIIKDDQLKAQIERLIAQCDFAGSYDFTLWDGKFVNFGENINSESSEYCAVLPMKDSFMLFTKRMSENIDGKVSVIAWEDIFFSKNKNKLYREADNSNQLSDFSNLSTEEDKHYAVVSCSYSGDTLVMYKENTLWYATYEGEWGMPVKFPKEINFGRNQRHGCFSKDGNLFVFSSKAKNGTGGFDLYYVTSLGAGQWSEPQLMTGSINTPLDEDSPFLTEDGSQLFFASKGHQGFGGYDIFYCEKVDSGWSEPKNVGKPFNSPGDDIFFNVAIDESKTATLSSSRSGGYGQMDIYYFYQFGQSKFSDCRSLVGNDRFMDSTLFDGEIVFSGKDTLSINERGVFSSLGILLQGAQVSKVFFKQDTLITEADSISLIYDSIGVYSIQMELLARADDDELRYCLTRDIVVVEPKPKELIRHVMDENELALSFGSKIKDEDMLPLPEGFNLELESVYFDFNKSAIRTDQRKKMDKNIELIKANPNLVIKVIGHTDKVGSDEYNLKLSTKRAKAAVDYLVGKGVKAQQIVAVLSEGEDGSRYKKEDGTDDIEKMQESRRVDFYIIGTSK